MVLAARDDAVAMGGGAARRRPTRRLHQRRLRPAAPGPHPLPGRRARPGRRPDRGGQLRPVGPCAGQGARPPDDRPSTSGPSCWRRWPPSMRSWCSTRTRRCAIVAAIQPDVLVKGADWADDAIVGRDVVEARGGRVVRVRARPGLLDDRACWRAAALWRADEVSSGRHRRSACASRNSWWSSSAWRRGRSRRSARLSAQEPAPVPLLGRAAAPRGLRVAGDAGPRHPDSARRHDALPHPRHRDPLRADCPLDQPRRRCWARSGAAAAPAAPRRRRRPVPERPGRGQQRHDLRREAVHAPGEQRRRRHSSA